MLNGIDGYTGSIPARTVLLQPYGDGTAIHEEEVPRAGAIVTRSYQRTRGHDGKTYVWVGRRKQTGRGEGSSGLKFDYIERNSS